MDHSCTKVGMGFVRKRSLSKIKKFLRKFGLKFDIFGSQDSKALCISTTQQFTNFHQFKFRIKIIPSLGIFTHTWVQSGIFVFRIHSTYVSEILQAKRTPWR